MTIGLIVGCKDPKLGPDDGKKPNEQLNQISFDNPAVGQKSVYVHFVAFELWQRDSKEINYTNDTLTLEITNQIDDNTFIITETMSGSYFERYDVMQNEFTMKVYADSISFEGKDYSGLALFGQQNLSLVPTSKNEFETKDWVIAPNTSDKNLDGYIFDYSVGDTSFAGINAFVNYEPMTYDGPGTAIAYNRELGVVRSYTINPWTAQADGFDLVNLMEEETQRTDFVDTKWELVSATTVDGKVKTAKELEAERYSLYFINETDISLDIVNKAKGIYKIEDNKIKIDFVGSITEIGAPFQELLFILLEAKTFSATTNKLIIYSDNNEYSSVEFKLVRPDNSILALTKNKWKLSQLVLSDRSRVSLEDYLGDNNFATNFSLNFLNNNYYEGVAGCNRYEGKYYQSGTNILQMNGENITKVYCAFSDEYFRILNSAISYDFLEGSLNINTDHDEVKSLIFVPTR